MRLKFGSKDYYAKRTTMKTLHSTVFESCIWSILIYYDILFIYFENSLSFGSKKEYYIQEEALYMYRYLLNFTEIDKGQFIFLLFSFVSVVNLHFPVLHREKRIFIFQYLYLFELYLFVWFIFIIRNNIVLSEIISLNTIS